MRMAGNDKFSMGPMSLGEGPGELGVRPPSAQDADGACRGPDGIGQIAGGVVVDVFFGLMALGY